MLRKDFFGVPRAKRSQCFNQHNYDPIFYEVVNEFSRGKLCPIFNSKLYLYFQSASLIIIIIIIIIIIVMDDSCTAQIFPSGTLNALAHTIDANIHQDIIHTHTRTRACARNMKRFSEQRQIYEKSSLFLISLHSHVHK